MAKPVKKVAKEVFTNVIPQHLRGTIKGVVAAAPARKGGDVTNAEYASKNGCTPRHASKVRRGYNTPTEL